MTISIEPWGDGHLDVLLGLDSPEMTAHLGGPEGDEKVRARNDRYVRLSALPEGGTFLVRVDGEPAGNVNYWASDDSWEMGWGVLPPYQGRGVATSAVLMALEKARRESAHRFVEAVTRESNVASNAVCRRVGFTLARTESLEYPIGVFAPSNVWIYDLQELHE